ncbi:hypothetical protein M758_6G121600 [Ceratodon purpureus]|uniref:Uncharacterized protein n=1 Tax=Ceratodon purpureus TaxID=3225 RepID=A0A8T0HIU4_CERPU|nr:hypothetical protein KC19_6G126200 [Ceratodon purpureus]KAG0613683.1 hypothetical protein M758_6G121600 [Ceratodon purpureus]
METLLSVRSFGVVRSLLLLHLQFVSSIVSFLDRVCVSDFFDSLWDALCGVGVFCTRFGPWFKFLMCCDGV